MITMSVYFIKGNFRRVFAVRTLSLRIFCIDQRGSDGRGRSTRSADQPALMSYQLTKFGRKHKKRFRSFYLIVMNILHRKEGSVRTHLVMPKILRRSEGRAGTRPAPTVAFFNLKVIIYFRNINMCRHI
jgi:hypothetical protein